MTDDQLHDELERRRQRVSLGSDWARHDLLPAVSSGIDARPQRVATSRGPALAGLAGALVILLVLVVAMPRLIPGPGPVPSSTGSVDVSPAPSPVAPAAFHTYSTSEFAAALAAGELRSSTVLVEGGIGEDLRFGRLCPPRNECYIGQLVGAVPEVELFANWMSVPAGEGVQIAEEPSDSTWPWWTLPSGTDSWPMLLRVDENGKVSYIGYAVGSTGAPTWTVKDMLALDPSTRSVSQVFVVDGWLTETEPSGTTIYIDCMTPSVSPVAGLPARYCQPGDKLSALSVDPANPRADDSGRSIIVQRSAAQQFGGPEASSHGLFAISPRLYAGCIDEAPCWQWDVVGRLSQAPPDQPNPPAMTSTPEPDGQILDPRTFATRVTAGELTGQTVLVNGTIGEFEAFDGSLVCKEDGVTCLMGRLQRTDSEAVNVFGRPIDTSEDDPASRRRADGGWPWVSKPAVPVTGTLVLSVEEDDTVEFIGVSANSDRPALNAEAMSQLPVDTATSGEIYVVDAWLTASLLEPPCAAPDPFTFIGELPNRWCGGPDWLIDEPVSIESGPPPNGLGVQSGAYREFAPDPTLSGSVGEPRFGSYLVSRRLEGWCDGATPPCWQWEVVGRLSQGPVDQPIATPIASPTPTAEGLACDDSSSISLVDRTGLVSSCSPWQWDFDESFDSTLKVTNPGGDLSELLVTWGAINGCVNRAATVFERDGDRYRLTITDGPNVPICMGPMNIRGFGISLVGPVNAALVTVAEHLESTITVYPTSCTGGLKILDPTYSLSTCSFNPAGPDDMGITHISAREVRVGWIGSSCSETTSAELTVAANGYNLGIVESDPTAPGCEGSAVPRRLDLQFQLPYDPYPFSATLNGTPLESNSLASKPGSGTPTQPEMACTEVDWLGIPMSLTDDTDLVTSCEQTSPTVFPVDGALSIVFNNGDASTLQVQWRQPACFGPASLRFARDGGGYRLTIADSTGSVFTCVDGPSDYVRRGVVLHLVQPINADSVSVVPQG